MAAPNIVSITGLFGKTAVQSVTTSATAIVTNGAASGKVFKVNSLIVSNIDGLNTADITVNLLRSSVNYALASTITVPADSTLIIISRDTAVFLEEGDSITLTASANGDLQAICSYEEVN